MRPRSGRLRWRAVAVVAAASAAAAVMPPAHAAAPPPSPAPGPAPRPGGTARPAPAPEPAKAGGAGPSAEAPRTVTLVTGDRVRLGRTETGQYTAEVETAPRAGGRRPVIATQAGPDGLYVIPDDAQAAILAGRVDRELFNAAYLAENGYADDRVTTVPVIVQYPRGRGAAALKAADELPASTPGRPLESIDGAAVKVAKDQAASFWSALVDGGRARALRSGVDRLWLDRKVRPTLERSVPLIGAPEAWKAGHDGAGVKVAVLDTGVDATHPDLAGKVTASRSFIDGEEVTDRHGHGTHVASTVAGTGAASGGRRKGVAPGASLLVGKVLSDAGEGSWSQVIDGMEWAVASGAKVVSMSLGGGLSDGTDPASQAVDRLTESGGALFVIAAGNQGPTSGGVDAPGAATSALTVAATDKSDGMAEFSSAGPRAVDGALKPDIAAPGKHIVAARAAGSEMCRDSCSQPGDGPVDERHTSASGTSMATPHVAGAAAVLAQHHPDWPPARLKAALMSSAKDAGHRVYAQGAGRLDLARADTQPVLAVTPNADFGRTEIVPEPKPAAREITYANHGDRPVTLRLAAELTDPAGKPVQGRLTADESVTVPAGGTATAKVTLDVSGLPKGAYSGRVTATDQAGAVRLATPVGLVLAPPTARLTVRTLGRDGEPAQPVLQDVIDVKDDLGRVTEAGVAGEGVTVFQVPLGVYSVTQWAGWSDGDSRFNLATLIDPEVTVTGDTEITLDAREARRISFTTPRPAGPIDVDGHVQTLRTTAGGERYDLSSWDFNGWVRWWATPTETVRTGGFHFGSQWTLGRPKVTMSVVSPAREPLDAIAPPSAGGEQGGHPGHVPVTGVQDLQVADAGRGRPEDLAGRDLRGRLVLMEADHTGGECGIWIERIQAVREAGAAALAAFPPAGSGCPIPLPILQERLTGPPKPIGIRNVALAAGDAAALRERLARGAVTVRLSGEQRTPYFYSLTPFSEGRVPADLHHTFTERSLAQVDNVLHTAAKPGESVYVHLAGLRDSVYAPVVQALGAPEDIGEATREYIGPLSPKILHQRTIAHRPAAPGAGTDQSLALEVFDRPGRVTRRWHAVPATPGSHRVSAAVAAQLAGTEKWIPFRRYSVGCQMCRAGDNLFAPFATVINGFPYVGAIGHPGYEARLFKDGKEIPGDGQHGGFPSFTLSPEPGTYRYSVRNGQNTTDWTFTSSRPVRDGLLPGTYCRPRDLLKKGPCAPQPLVYVGYDLGDSLATDNTVRAPGAHRFRVEAYHAQSAEAMPRIAGLRLWASTDDGRTWRPLPLVPRGNGVYDALAVHPKASATSGAVSLKAEAWDAAGNRVEQTTLRAFGLRDAGTATPRAAKP
ncbi:S8 family peptidase [Bailinhaonella thermotolerans]|uniref:Serine protease n=1 Tax=Bailinhaonella thermotolerans TaxID=1070861 RepID=A0A3A4AZF9_9ACTN|nr:S8 family serine peptidase [Bailinhaonella thermotolerans]RJL34513.1 serine protease [Bailinhaonella thermotolerans]